MTQSRMLATRFAWLAVATLAAALVGKGLTPADGYGRALSSLGLLLCGIGQFLNVPVLDDWKWQRNAPLFPNARPIALLATAGGLLCVLAGAVLSVLPRI